MKTQIQKSEGGKWKAETAQPFAVNYQWSGSDGTIFRGHTVASGRDQSHAERRFFRQHRHVMREGFAILPVLVVVLILVIGGLSVALGITRAELRDCRETARGIEAVRAAYVHNVEQHSLAERAPFDLQTSNSDLRMGGIK